MTTTKEKAWKSGWVPTPLNPETVGEAHAWPINDAFEHELSIQCRCHPEVKPQEHRGKQYLSVSHNAADCREITEHAEKRALAEGKN